MDHSLTTGLKAAAVSAALLLAGGGAALAVGGGADPAARPAKAISTEDGTAGEEAYRTRSALVNAGSYGSAVARCPKTKHATGGGYRVGADDGTIVVQKNGGFDGTDADLIPDDGWEVYVHNTGASSVGITASVICRK